MKNYEYKINEVKQRLWINLLGRARGEFSRVIAPHSWEKQAYIYWQACATSRHVRVHEQLWIVRAVTYLKTMKNKSRWERKRERNISSSVAFGTNMFPSQYARISLGAQHVNACASRVCVHKDREGQMRGINNSPLKPTMKLDHRENNTRSCPAAAGTFYRYHLKLQCTYILPLNVRFVAR